MLKEGGSAFKISHNLKKRAQPPFHDTTDQQQSSGINSQILKFFCSLRSRGPLVSPLPQGPRNILTALCTHKTFLPFPTLVSGAHKNLYCPLPYFETASICTRLRSHCYGSHSRVDRALGPVHMGWASSLRWDVSQLSFI